jgi:cyclophilin family peptidyl-prolyl cis-trans isomerase/HEAT repeat protein
MMSPSRLLPVLLAATLGGCAPTPPLQLVPVVPAERKLSWILRLEDQRILRDPPPPPVEPAPGRRAAPAPPTPDLTALVEDGEARIRRRAALAIGRVGLSEGVAPLVRTLADPDPDVRQMAAFALGLLGSREAVESLLGVLRDDAMPLVRGRAAEALGLIGEGGAAEIGEMVAAMVATGVPGGVDPGEERTVPPEAEAFRLGVYALTRLNAYEPLAGAVLDSSGRPVVRWWPVAYALQRLEDPRGLTALIEFARGGERHGAAFGARGLGAVPGTPSVDALLPLLQVERSDPAVVISAVRALARIGDARAAPPLLELLTRRELDGNQRLEVVSALGTLRAPAALDHLLDLLTHAWPALRAAALRALSRLEQEQFLLVLSGLDPDPHWSVRAALAESVTALPPELARPRLMEMLQDEDRRVLPAVLAGLPAVDAPGAVDVLLQHLQDADPVVRLAAARQIGELRPPQAAGALADAYRFGAGDPTYVARAAALGALARYGREAAEPTLRRALADKDWAVRVRAVSLLEEIGAGDETLASAIRPAPTGLAPADYEDPGLLRPEFSPHVYLETARGTIQIELAVLDAPLTAHNFVTLARRGFFDGLSFHRVVPNFVIQGGDPRGDGEGGPAYTIRDELNERPYHRGTVGMALDWADTGGSQFFIAHSPQPHLDARYTVFGRVVAGMEVVDQIRQWDVVQRVRVWDGVQFTRAKDGRARASVQ